MNRRSFFKFLGIGAATAAAAPLLKHFPLPAKTPFWDSQISGSINVNDVYDAYAQIARHNLIPPVIFMHPRTYESLGGDLSRLS